MSKNWKPEIQTWPVTKLTGYARNTKHHNERQVNALAGSISAYGFVVPILADSQGIIIAGHCRVEAAKKLGMQEVPVIVADHLSEGEVRALRLADNRLNESPWDTDMLRFELKGLEDMGIDLSLAAFGDIPDLTKFIEDGKIVDGLFDSPRHTGEEQPESLEVVEGEDDVPEVPEKLTWVKPGDLWTLGRHRLLCGDSTKRADVERLMGSERAQLWSSDPPYGIDFVAIAKEKCQSQKYDDIENDDLQDEALKDFIFSAIDASLPFMQKPFAFYMWHAMKMQAYFSQAAAAAAAAGILFHRQIIWEKPQFVFGRGHYHWKHELCLMGWLKGHEPPFYGERNQDTIWKIGRENDKIHPTQKPVEIFAIPIRNHLKTGEIVYEPFSGSGSNLIAAEKMGVRCFGMELSAHYCAVILRRWAEFTGNDPVRSDGTKLSELMEQDAGGVSDSR